MSLEREAAKDSPDSLRGAWWRSLDAIPKLVTGDQRWQYCQHGRGTRTAALQTALPARSKMLQVV